MTDPQCERDHMEVRIAYEVRLLNQRIDLLEAAKALQAGEYERRLSELNHAHAQAVQKEGTFLGREAFELTQKEYAQFRELVLTHISKSDATRATWTSAAALVASVVAVVASIVAIYLGLR